MKNHDRITELYQGEIWSKELQEQARERIHWLCSRVEGERVLDIGCSQGICSILLAREGKEVTGIDIYPRAIEYAEELLNEQPSAVQARVKFVEASLYELGSDEIYDSIVLGEVLEHQTNPREFLIKTLAHLDTHGTLVLSVPFGFAPDPDHKQTFFFSNLFALLEHYLELDAWEISGKHICISGKKHPGRLDDAPEGLLGEFNWAAVLKATEKYLLVLQKLAFERQGRDKRKLEDLQQSLEGKRAQAERFNALRHTLQTFLERAENQRFIADHFNGRGALFDGKEIFAEDTITSYLEYVLEELFSKADRLTRTKAEQSVAIKDLEGKNADLLQQNATQRDSALLEQTNITKQLQEAKAQLKTRDDELQEKIEQLKARDDELQEKTEQFKTRDDELQEKIEQLGALEKSFKQEKESHSALMQNLLQELSSTKAARDTLLKAIDRNQDENGRLESEKAELHRLKEIYRGEIRELKSKIRVLENEVRYKLGDLLVSTIDKPKQIFDIPKGVLRLFREGQEKRAQRLGPSHRKMAKSVQVPSPSSRAEIVQPDLKSVPTKVQAKESKNVTKPKPVKSDKGQRESVGNYTLGKRESYPFIKKAGVKAFSDLRIACVMDKFTHSCFEPECELVQLSRTNWKSELEAENFDLLFVESAWNGSDGAWKYQLTNMEKKPASELPALAKHCKNLGIPSVFWNKEDPPNYSQFIAAAKHFDYVFTTDEGCIPQYFEDLGHKNVFPLPFAAQPKIHNPVSSGFGRESKVAFAGTWYENKHPDRKVDMENLLSPALKYSLDIFDRMHLDQSGKYRFPDVYQKSIQCSLDYEDMLDAYRRYEVFLNVNSVQDSPTMFSRRVFELMACGTIVVSGYSLGIDKLLGADLVPMSQSKDETEKWLDLFFRNPQYRKKVAHLGLRKVMTEHTYQHRLNTILTTIGMNHKVKSTEKNPLVSVVCCTNRKGQEQTIIDNFINQEYPNKELIILLNDNALKEEDYFNEAKRRQLNSPMKVLRLDESESLGKCLNHGFRHADGQYFSKFDDDNFYGKYFLSDLMRTFDYTDADIVGKCSHYCYLSGMKALVVRFPGKEHKYTDFIQGGGMLFTRRAFEAVGFPDKSRGEDSQFLKDCLAMGYRIYSADPYNFVSIRHEDPSEHTWQMEELEFLRKCEIVCYTDDYVSQTEI